MENQSINNNIENILQCLASLRASITELEKTVNELADKYNEDINDSPYAKEKHEEEITELDEEIAMLLKDKKKREQQVMNIAMKRNFNRRPPKPLPFENKLQLNYKTRRTLKSPNKKRIKPRQLFALPPIHPIQPKKMLKLKIEPEEEEKEVLDIEEEMFPFPPFAVSYHDAKTVSNEV